MENKISKQVLIIRKDLNMRKGKIASQAAHASLKAILDIDPNPNYENSDFIQIPITKNINEPTALKDWLSGRYTKICVCVNSEEELKSLYNQAKEKGLACSLITDTGLTEFNNVPTITCCAIGPAWDFEIDPITGKLPLL